MNPLTKFGFIKIGTDDKIVHLTDTGTLLLNTPDENIGEVLLKSFIKWQLPIPEDRAFSDENLYSVVPFVNTLRLIALVNRLEQERGNKAIGLQKREFALFAMTLTRESDTIEVAKKVLCFRDLQKGKNEAERKKIRHVFYFDFISQIIGTTDAKTIEKFSKNLNDYADNAIRYFRLTNFICLRGNGYYIDLENARKTEIEALFEKEFYKPRSFSTKTDYNSFLSSDDSLIFPWEEKSKLFDIASKLHSDYEQLSALLGEMTQPYDISRASSIDSLKGAISDLRLKIKGLRNKLEHNTAQSIKYIETCIEDLAHIYEFDEGSRALRLERLSTNALHAINDAKSVSPNYPVGDDNEPTTTAPAGKPDIECAYEDFNMICEVTMLKNRDQWHNEGYAVQRHLREFENSHENCYCLFVAPSIHVDTAETFWVANSVGYQGKKLKIVPITISQFSLLLETLIIMKQQSKKFSRINLKDLLDKIIQKASQVSSSDWIDSISGIIADWSDNLAS